MHFHESRLALVPSYDSRNAIIEGTEEGKRLAEQILQKAHMDVNSLLKLRRLKLGNSTANEDIIAYKKQASLTHAKSLGDLHATTAPTRMLLPQLPLATVSENEDADSTIPPVSE